MTPTEQNALMRQLLIKNSPKIMVKLPTVTGALGGTTRIKLNNTGLITRLFAVIELPYNFSAAPTLGAKGAFALTPKINLYDFDGSFRVNTSAYLLQVANSFRGRNPSMTNARLQVANGFDPASAPAGALPFFEPEQRVNTGSNTLRYVVEIPVAADVRSGDLRGMIAAQFVSGELQLAVDFASAISGTADDDFVFNGGTLASVGAPTVTVYQEYYLPQKINGVLPIPQDDISTVYELGVYSRTTDNIASGQEKLLNFPIVREINGVFVDYITNKLLGGGSSAANDLQKFTVYANGNNIMYQADRYFQLSRQRAQLGSDLPAGTYGLDFSDGPISTAIFGNVQLAVVPGASPTNAAVEVCFESLYAKGSALSGAPV